MKLEQRGCSAGRGRAIRRGFTVKELIVVVICLGMLALFIIPAPRFAHEAARRADCQSRMRQVAMAVQSYAMANADQIPVGVVKGSRYTAQSMLLPFLEGAAVYKDFNGFTATADKSGAATKNRLPIFICPSDNPSGTYASPGGGTYARSNVVFSFGSDTMEPKQTSTLGMFRIGDSASYTMTVMNGDANTAIASEIVAGKSNADPSGAWGYGEAGSCGFTHKKLPTNSPVPPILAASATDFSTADAVASSNHPGGVNVVYGGNHVQMVSTSIDLATWQALGTCNSIEAKGDNP
ncbi:MAG: DUF1559 domain-containing protein [Planctomycetia bacterium]|nr:DUF1559 domain-containing protein [Planctomycetia bacterium]